MLLPSNSSSTPKLTNQRSHQPDRSQQDDYASDLSFNKINVALVSVGLLFALLTLIVAILQWQQVSQRDQAATLESTVEPEGGWPMEVLGSLSLKYFRCYS